MKNRQNKSKTVDIYFYIHPYFWPKGDIPKNADANWPGFGFGPYAWTIQTYLRLHQAGFPCQLTSIVPEEGILIAHRECLSATDGFFKEKVVSKKKLFIVDISADLQAYLQANLHIVQNKQQEKRYPKSYYLRHWPQPGLIPRNPERGDKFENIAYFGNKKNLVSELRTQEWERELEALNLNWVEKDQKFNHLDPNSYLQNGIWNDFSNIDAIVAIRGFSPKNEYGFCHKPASKLFNAWIAGVPAILGRESAYFYERKNELDYLEANSISEVLNHLKTLKNDPALRKKMILNGFERAKEIDANATVTKWINLLQNVIIQEYDRWKGKSRINQALSIYLGCARYQCQRATRKVLRVINFQAT